MVDVVGHHIQGAPTHLGGIAPLFSMPIFGLVCLSNLHLSVRPSLRYIYCFILVCGVLLVNC